jgi:hypothetical protein
MKLGCIAVLLTIGGAFAGYRNLLTGSELEGQPWIAGLLAVVAGMLIGNIHGLLLALKQKQISGRQRSEWNDGDLVVVSGRIQSTRSPMVSPFSGTPSVILEYEVKSADSESASSAHFSGFMMTPCSVFSTQGSVNVIGFPLMVNLPSKACVQEAEYQRAAEFLKRTKFEEKLSNPITLLKQLNEVFSKTDGDLSAHFSSGKSPLDLETMQVGDISEHMMSHGLKLQETLIPNGAEVTVSGTFRANRQAVEVSGGLTKLSHKLELGSASVVTGGNLRKSFIGIIIFVGLFGAGNYFLLKQLGLLGKFAIGQ